MKGYKCNQCGDNYLKNEMRYMDKQDGPYCKYCAEQWNNIKKRKPKHITKLEQETLHSINELIGDLVKLQQAILNKACSIELSFQYDTIEPAMTFCLIDKLIEQKEKRGK